MSEPLPPPQNPDPTSVADNVLDIGVTTLTPVTPGAAPATVTLPDGTHLVRDGNGQWVPEPAAGAEPVTSTLPDGTEVIHTSDGDWFAPTAPTEPPTLDLPPPIAELPPPAAYPVGSAPPAPAEPTSAPPATRTIYGFKGLLATLATLSTVAIIAVAVTRSDDRTFIDSAVPPTSATITPPAVPPATVPLVTLPPATLLPEEATVPSTTVTVTVDGGPAIALVLAAIDFCVAQSSFTAAEAAQVTGELSYTAAPSATADVWIVTISNVAAGRDGDWTVDVATGAIDPVLPFGPNSIYFDLQWCMFTNALGLG